MCKIGLWSQRRATPRLNIYFESILFYLFNTVVCLEEDEDEEGSAPFKYLRFPVPDSLAKACSSFAALSPIFNSSPSLSPPAAAAPPVDWCRSFGTAFTTSRNGSRSTIGLSTSASDRSLTSMTISYFTLSKWNVCGRICTSRTSNDGKVASLPTLLRHASNVLANSFSDIQSMAVLLTSNEDDDDDVPQRLRRVGTRDARSLTSVP